MLILAQLMRNENSSISKYEQELQVLGSLPKYPWELTSRIEWLLRKVHGSQAKILKYESESAALSRILQNEN
jgi:hypothetical protein